MARAMWAMWLVMVAACFPNGVETHVGFVGSTCQRDSELVVLGEV